MYIRPSMFETDKDLQDNIEGLVSYVWPDSKRAWEEFHLITDFGLAQKPEGAIVQPVQAIQDSGILRVIHKVFCLYCIEPEDSPLVRAVLFGAIASKIEEYPKDQLQLIWRRRPETYVDNDFDTTITKYQTIFRVGVFLLPPGEVGKDLLT